MQTTVKRIKMGQKLGKYRLERKLGEGGFATVYQAMDTIEGLRVALKIPFPRLVDADLLQTFRHEVRLSANLEHPNILPIKNADFIDGHFVVAYPLGDETLAERMQRRMSLKATLDFAEQMLSAVDYAHSHRIIHCDIKPENLILFPDNKLMLTDFGIAKIALETIDATGSGTLGYMAPEQAMGKPSFRSDVFSMGLIIYRMLSGRLPEWPYEWPPPGFDRLRGRIHPDMIGLIQRAIEMNPVKRYRDADQMHATFKRARTRTLAYWARQRPAKNGTRSKKRKDKDWQSVRHRQFLRLHGKELEVKYTCTKCAGPVAENMQFCPWCAKERKKHTGTTQYPQKCPRCRRGLKLDWRFCPWCFGAGFNVQTTREFSDKRYTARCKNPKCERKSLMPFMRYCPWCRRKVKSKWIIPEVQDKCSGCSWGIVKSFWSYCPWCGKSTSKR